MTTSFRIGLVMTGAVSAGSYTAGVLDFLLESLDAWEQAKQRHRTAGDQPAEWSVPAHDISLEIISGTSAGALCAGLLGVTLGRKFTPKNGINAPPPAENRLYDLLVKQARIENLLETTDLADGKIYSLLDSEYLTRIATKALQASGPYQRPNYVAPQLELIATNGNLRGIDYAINYSGNNNEILGMINHADYKQFYINTTVDPEGNYPGACWLNPNQPTATTWTVELRDAILASAAFPIGLAARKLQQHPITYHQQDWPIPQSVSLATPSQSGGVRYNLLIEEGKIPPNCPEANASNYDFAAVDGGITNDEPVEFARRRLAGKRIHNPRGLIDADAAVLMIDPFPNLHAPGAEYQINIELLPVGMRLIQSLLEQSRFKLAELVLAQNTAVASRFMITPTRRLAPDQPAVSPALAASVLGMFGGFLTESFREHDFQLGRLNCQSFLKNWFLLDAENPVFQSDDSGPASEKFVMLKDDPDPPFDAVGKHQRRLRAIIPLVNDLEQPLIPPVWPQISRTNLEDILQRLIMRAHALVTTAINTRPADKSWLSTAAWGRSLTNITVLTLWRFWGKNKLKNLLRTIIITELTTGNQIV